MSYLFELFFVVKSLYLRVECPNLYDLVWGNDGLVRQKKLVVYPLDPIILFLAQLTGNLLRCGPTL